VSRSGELSVRPGGVSISRLTRLADRTLPLLAEPRLGVGLLLAACIANVAGAALPEGAWLARTPPYLALLAAVAVSGMAAVAVRLPAGWTAWRRPRPLADTPEASRFTLAMGDLTSPSAVLEDAERVLRLAGYRVSEWGNPDRVVVAGVRRGWAQLASLAAHLAVVLLVLGAGIGLAFGHETTFSLLPGGQALLDDARPGFTDVVRLDSFDGRFGADGRPARLDTFVTFLSGGTAVSHETLQVNAPGAFGGYLVHAWTYGPAVRLRAATLGGRPLLDAALPLDQTIAGAPGGFARLPTLGDTLGAALVDAGANRLRLTIADGNGILDSVELQRGETARLGLVEVTVEDLTSYVTFLSRRDPGMGLLFGGAGLLVASLAIGLWLPRRRITARIVGRSLQVLLRGGALDDPSAELARLEARMRTALTGDLA